MNLPDLHFRPLPGLRRALSIFVLICEISFGQVAEKSPTSDKVQENWASIRLSDSPALQLAKPLLMQKDEFDTYTRELLDFQWRPGDPVYVYVLIPRLVPKPPVILYLYNYNAELDQFADNKLGEFLTKDGFAAVAFLSAMGGHRYHDRPMKQWFVSELQESLGESTHDVQMILNYLETRNDVDTGRIGMFGEGSGGTIGILSAAADPRIKALEAVDPWGDWPDWLAKSPVVPEEERANYVKPEFLKTVAPLDPVGWLPKLTIPLHLEYLREKVNPASVRQSMEAAAPAQMERVPLDQAVAEYKKSGATRLVGWLKKELHNQPEGK